MQSRLIALSIAATLALPTLARAGGIHGAAQWTEEAAEDHRWITCLEHYTTNRDDKTADHFADDTKLGPLAKAVGKLPAGATPTLKEVADECLAQAKQDPQAVDAWTSELKLKANLRYDIASLRKGEFGLDTLQTEARSCMHLAELAAQVIDPRTPLEIGSDELAWKGTVADLHQICDEANAAVDEAETKLAAPYIAVGMKNDKLQMIKEHEGQTYFQIPGGESTLDAKKLMKANVWFLAWDGGSCARGGVTRLERFQFDGGQKLVKTTSKEYCGDVPKSAYR